MRSTHHEQGHGKHKDHDQKSTSEQKHPPEQEAKHQSSNADSKVEKGLNEESLLDDTKRTASEPKREPKKVTITDIELENLKSELSEYKDKYMRALAESENARKRLQKEKQEMIQYALQNVIVDFLSPIDHMENALKFTQQMSEEVKHWAIGFQMILTQFKDALTLNGVTSFDSEGKPFDPHFQEAIENIVTTDFPAGTVVEESVKGYKMGERLIRPARVKVAKAPNGPGNKDENNDNQTIE